MKSSSSRAFTLIDLLAVIGLACFIVAMVAPALARTRPGNQVARCLNNTRQLAAAWQMYSADNNGRLVVNLHGGSLQGGGSDPIYGVSWVEGWLDWTTRTDNTNAAFLITSRYAKLAPYLNPTATNLFQCPADTYVTGVQRAAGWTRRARSYSANIGVGAGNAEAGPFDPMYRHFIKDSDFVSPGPAENWVYLEEHPDSMNDPAFFNPRTTTWIDLPAAYHNGACAFGFADGHSEMHKWSASLASGRATQVLFNTGQWSVTPNAPKDADVGWMIHHAGTMSPSTY